MTEGVEGVITPSNNNNERGAGARDRGRGVGERAQRCRKRGRGSTPLAFLFKVSHIFFPEGISFCSLFFLFGFS